ncbi:MAG TPA: hypothetical protein EYQ31_15570 [Candidatus Handelsmanbacteria bacterium]|nr:hypothetical protein [Candidatus Handelsmanbacteria bacterium]
MTTVFYTYVWGSNPNLGVPLTFTANHHRAFAAKRATVEQDAVVFGAVTRLDALLATVSRDS